MHTRLFRLMLCVLVLFAGCVTGGLAEQAEETEAVRVTIDFAAKRYLGGESALDRSKYLNVHSDYAGTVLEPADLEKLTRDYGVGFGRFFSSPFYWYQGGAPYPSTQVMQGLASFKLAQNAEHPNAMYRTTRRVVTEHPRVAFRMGEDYADAARFAADFFEFFFTDEDRPDYYEPMNEPFVHAGDFGEDQEEVRKQMAMFYKAIGEEFDRRGLSTKVVGYASAWPSQELWDFGHWDGRMKMFMDVAGPHMDAISVHLYDGTNVTGQDNRRSGSNADAILDLIETYGFIKWGAPKPHALTEYGDIPKGFEPGYTDARGSAELNTINHMFFGFLERQDRIDISIPFITTKSPWYYSQPENHYQPYPVDLWRPDPDAIVDGEVTAFLPTIKWRFYDLWRDVRGDRAVAFADDPDTYARAFVHGDTAFVCLNNLEDQEQKLELNQLTEPAGFETVTVKRLNIPAEEAAIYTEETSDQLVSELLIAPHESIILQYHFAQPILRTTRVESTAHYSKTYLQPIEAGQPITFTFTDIPVGRGRASLRMGLGRKHDKSKAPVVLVNGQELAVPDDWPGYDQANRKDFFGAISIPVPVEVLTTQPIVELTFPDSGGHVSSLVLTVERESPL